MSPRRCLFFDIDGTLAAGGYGETRVPDSTRLALKKLREAGHVLCIATGRSEAMAAGFMRELGFENMVSDGGNGVTVRGRLLGIRPLPREKVVALVRECERKGLAWGIQTGNSDTRLVPDGRFEEETHDIYMKSRVVPGLAPEDYDCIYKAYVACEAPREEGLVALRDLPWCRFTREYIFVEPTDKAAGIRRVLREFNAAPRDAVVFGDSRNDLSMFTDEWTKVAMGNAVPELKAIADYVTTDVGQDGIYNACLALGLF